MQQLLFTLNSLNYHSGKSGWTFRVGSGLKFEKYFKLVLGLADTDTNYHLFSSRYQAVLISRNCLDPTLHFIGHIQGFIGHIQDGSYLVQTDRGLGLGIIFSGLGLKQSVRFQLGN